MKEDFWDPTFRHLNPTGASAHLIAETEKSLQVKLPETYSEVMRVQNGGYSLYTRVFLPESDNQINTENLYWLSAEVFHTLEELEPLTQPDQAGWDIHAEQLELLIAFKQNGACFWCFDYRKSGRQGDPAIVYIDAECEIETQVAPDCSWLFSHLVRGEE